ncbi:MAG TPA: ADP-ribosylglycohydrolase family protein [Verrucomicrobiales bacterium]|nr:ADP-ribosylglycohydrolase family protein [Verrucomicrobiales bacterium]
MNEISAGERVKGGLLGAFIGDALAMPVHWYYETDKLRADYGHVTDYLAPRHPHADSFMEECSYQAPNPRGEILHDQAQYWGKAGIHYHRGLKPGENTLNLQLARQVWTGLHEDGGYDVTKQLRRYIHFMTTPGQHHDTYIERCHQHFFQQYAEGRDPLHCGRPGEKHLGGVAPLIPIIAFYHDNPEAGRIAALQHLHLTHLGEPMRHAAGFLAGSLQAVLAGRSLDEALRRQIAVNPLLKHPFDQLLKLSDEEVVGERFKTACYVEDAIPSVVYLALKHGNDPEQALIANTNLGGDSCHRGALLGALLGAAHGAAAWPERWVRGLVAAPVVST